MRKTAEVVLSNIVCSRNGLENLGAFAQSMAHVEGRPIQVDCSLMDWIDANIAAALRHPTEGDDGGI